MYLYAEHEFKRFNIVQNMAKKSKRNDVLWLQIGIVLLN